MLQIQILGKGKGLWNLCSS